MEKSESIKNLVSALLIFDKEVTTISKDNTNPFFKNKYASLSEILATIKEPLQKSKLTVKQFPFGEHELITMIAHESGEYILCNYKMKPVKDDPQGEGSRITYQRRYALGSALGLNIDDDDDDGNKASNLKPKTENPKPLIKVGDENFNKIVAALVDRKTTIEYAKSKFQIIPEVETKIFEFVKAEFNLKNNKNEKL